MRSIRYLLGLVAALALMLPASAEAQRSANRDLVALSTQDSCAQLDVEGLGTGTIELTGTWTGTVTFYVGGRSGTRNQVDVSKADTPSTAVNTATANGIWTVPVAGYKTMTACFTTASSGTVYATLGAAGTGGGSGGGGGGGGGEVTSGNAANFLATITDGAGALNVIVDSGSLNAQMQFAGTPASVNAGVLDNGTLRMTLATDGQAAIDLGSIANNTDLTADRLNTLLDRLQAAEQDDNPWTAFGTQFFARFDDTTPASVTENNSGALRMSANRNLYNTIRDAAGNERGANVNAAFQLTTLDGNSAAMLTALQLIDNLAASPDPCSVTAKQYLPINISTATTTEITASLAGASTHYYVCSINIGPTAGAQNLALVDDDTDNCASVTSGLAGGTTAGTGWNIAANSGFTFGGAGHSIARTNGTNRVLCLVSSAAVQTSGVITVVAAP